MAKKNLNLDNFFRDKLSGYEAPEKKGNWQLLNHLLDAKQRRKKTFRRLLFGLFFLGIVMSGFLIFMPGNERSTNIVESDKHKAPSASKAPVTDSIIEAGSYADTSNRNNDKGIAQTTGKEVSEQEKIIGNTITEKNKANQSKVPGSKGVKHSSAAGAAISLGEKPGISSESGSEKREEESEKNSDIVSNVEGEKAGEGSVKIHEEAIIGIEKVENKDSANINSPASEIALTDSVASDSLRTENTAKDSLMTSAKDSTTLKDSNPRFFSFNLFAGLNLHRTQSKTLTNERHVSPLVGLELQHPLSQYLTIGLGTFYSLQGGYHLSDTATQVSYFLEQNVSQQIILIRKQHRLYIPLTLYYNISDKHAVSGGIHWSYLVNTVGDYTETNSMSGNTTQSGENNVKGYMDGIKTSAFSFAIGYRFSLSGKFDISTRIIQELADSYTSEYFYGVNTEPSWSLQTFVSIKF